MREGTAVQKRNMQVILVVDPDGPRRDFARQRLERAGYPVVTASGSDDAFSLFRLVNIALVVTRGDNGLLERIAADSKLTTVPVVLTSPASSAAARRHTVAVREPVDGQLVDAVTKMLDS